VILPWSIFSAAREEIGCAVSVLARLIATYSHTLQMVPQGHTPLQRSEDCCGSSVAVSR
jgi:hypothetical protein